MGAYLSSPVCDKETIEDSNDYLSFVASSMQGWRISQEDDHNAILNYDDQTSFFAVYDGHGGAEIARYCSKYLPDFIKNLPQYKEGNYRQALIEGFIQFDSHLTDPKVKKILQKLVEEQDEEENPCEEDLTNLNPKENSIVHHQDDIDHQEEAKLLAEEAHLPIEDVLQRFQQSNSNSDKNENETKSIEEIPIQKESIENPSSSEIPSKQRRIRKPVSNSITTTITTETNSLIRHFISDNSDQMLNENDEDEDDDDDDDFDIDQSDDDEEEEGEGEGEDDEDNDDQPEEDETENEHEREIKEIMKKTILSVLSGEKMVNNDKEDEEEEEEEDLEMVDVENDPGSSSGCTAVVVILKNNDLYVANAGDSRCVLSRDGKALEMSVDHKPEDPDERQRIEKAGFKVTSDGRVSGGLNLSRAIGDHAYKKKLGLKLCDQAITPLPDVRHVNLDHRDEFLVVACDGIWNFMSSDEVIQFVRSRLDKKSLRQICEELFMHCLAPNTCGDGTGCDNMTAIIVRFHSQLISNEKCLSPKTCLTSSMSLNQKRCLSPSNDQNYSDENSDQQNKKKIKILKENDLSMTTEQQREQIDRLET